jgi:hypothetical protein
VGWCCRAQGDNCWKWRRHRNSNWLLELLMHKPMFLRCKGLLMYSQIQWLRLWGISTSIFWAWPTPSPDTITNFSFPFFLLRFQESSILFASTLTSFSIKPTSNCFWRLIYCGGV